MTGRDLEALVGEHLRRHPGFGPEDLAKLLYQGVMGMDHLLRDRERFIEELRREWEPLATCFFPGEVLLEPVHPSAPVARLNLRPAKGAGVRLAELAPLLADQPRREGQPGELLALWDEALELARAGQIPFRVDELDRWGELLRAGNHPPGHSAQYREMNRPAYRLVHDVADPELREILAGARLGSDLP